MQRTLVIMVKEPRPGRVKTRLGHDIGMVPAAWWFRRQSLALIQRLRDPRWALVLAVSPDTQGLRSRVWPADLPRSPQGRGDLGQRMRRQILQADKGPVCVIGADIPGITRSHIWRAFARLGPQDMVFGPAMDGGYWLVGHSRRRAVSPGLFRDVRWSGPHALTDSMASVGMARIALVDRLRDIDTVADLSHIV